MRRALGPGAKGTPRPGTAQEAVAQDGYGALGWVPRSAQAFVAPAVASTEEVDAVVGGVAGGAGALPTCYVASPCGFAESTMLWYQERLLPLLRRHVRVIDPWLYLEGWVGPVPDRERLLAIGRRNFAAIRDEADLVVAVLDQEPPDTGTVGEVTSAAAWGKPVVGYRGDVRRCGEPGLRYNVMVTVAIAMSGGCEVGSLEAMEQAVRDIVWRLHMVGEEAVGRYAVGTSGCGG